MEKDEIFFPSKNEREREGRRREIKNIKLEPY
jgi:hypothetical protein